MYMYFKQIYRHIFVHLYIISYIVTIEYELYSHIFFPFHLFDKIGYCFSINAAKLTKRILSAISLKLTIILFQPSENKCVT